MQKAFLITPFTPERAGNEAPALFRRVQNIVAKAVTAAGLSLVRPTEINAAGAIIEQVREALMEADVVLAILTGQNANVFYELGIALEKARRPAILIVRSKDDVPSDVRHHRYLTYGGEGDPEALQHYAKKRPGYRFMELFASPTHHLDSQFWGLGNSPSSVLDYLRRDKEHFTPVRMLFPHPLSEVESKAVFDPSNSILQITFSLKVFGPDTEYPDAHVNAYCSSDTFAVMLDSIRTEFTRQLVDLLPRIEAS